MFIPYKVDVAMERQPVANCVLIGLTILISLAMFKPLANWHEQRDAPSEELRQLLTDAGLTLPDPEPTIVDDFLLQPGHFRVSQLVGNLFIHAGWLHLLGNMLFLFVFGNAVNAKLGHATYLLVYLGSGAMESALCILVGPRVPCLGASGAIMGVVGAFLVLFPLNKVSIAWIIWIYYYGVVAFSAIWVIGAVLSFRRCGPDRWRRFRCRVYVACVRVPRRCRGHWSHVALQVRRIGSERKKPVAGIALDARGGTGRGT